MKEETIKQLIDKFSDDTDYSDFMCSDTWLTLVNKIYVEITGKVKFEVYRPKGK